MPGRWYITHYFTAKANLRQRRLRLQEAEAPRISRQSAHEGSKVVRPMHRPPLTPGDTPSLILTSVKGWVITRATVRPEGLSRWKAWMTLSGIEPETFWLVAQCHDLLCHRVPIHLIARDDIFPYNSSIYPISTPVITDINHFMLWTCSQMLVLAIQ
jgi:hypothetical protein